MQTLIQILAVGFLLAGIATHGFTRNFSATKAKEWGIAAVITMALLLMWTWEKQIKEESDAWAEKNLNPTELEQYYNEQKANDEELRQQMTEHDL